MLEHAAHYLRPALRTVRRPLSTIPHHLHPLQRWQHSANALVVGRVDTVSERDQTQLSQPADPEYADGEEQGHTLTWYRQRMQQLTTQDDISEIRLLFQQRLDEHNSPLEIEDISPILEHLAHHADAKAVFDEIERFRIEHNFEPWPISWDSLLTSFGRAENTKDSTQLFQHIQRLGNIADARIYSRFMRICARQGLTEQVETLAHSISDDRSTSPHGIHRARISAQINAGDLDTAESLANKLTPLDRSRFAPELCGLVLMAAAKLGDSSRVERVLRQMEKMGHKMNPKTYAALIRLQVAQHQVKKAEIMLGQRKELGIEPIALHYMIVAQAYIAQKKPAPAISILKNMVKDGVDPNAKSDGMLLRAMTMLEGEQTGKKYVKAQFEDPRGSQGAASDLELPNSEKLLRVILDRLGQTTQEGSSAPGFDGPARSRSLAREFAAFQPALDEQSFSRREAAPQYLSQPDADYYSTIMYNYGINGNVAKVRQLFNEFEQRLREQTNDSGTASTIPINILAPIMAASLYTGDGPRLDRCWTLCKTAAAQLIEERVPKALRTDPAGGKSPVQQLPWPLSRILEAPFSYITQAYGAGLLPQKSNIFRVVKFMDRRGLELSSENCNHLAQAFVRLGFLEEALGCCEKYLIDGWGGYGSWRAAERQAQAAAAAGAESGSVSGSNLLNYRQNRPHMLTLSTLRDALEAMKSAEVLEKLREQYPRSCSIAESFPKAKQRKDVFRSPMRGWRDVRSRHWQIS